MKALTICQPYAEFIVRGWKSVENRTWCTSYRGPLLIHAGLSRAFMTAEAMAQHRGRGDFAMAFGALVGVCDVVDCLCPGDLAQKWPTLLVPDHRDHVRGPWCFVLSNVRRFPSPIAHRGAQGLFDVNVAQSLSVEMKIARPV